MTSHATHGEGVSAREAAAPPRGVAGRWATLTAGVLLMVGIMTMLRSGHGEWDVQHARTVFFWPGHFLTGVAETAIGLVGIACATREHAARAFLTVSGLFLIAWAAAGLVLDADPNDVFTRRGWLVGLHLTAGVVGLVAAGVSASRASRGDQVDG